MTFFSPEFDGRTAAPAWPAIVIDGASLKIFEDVTSAQIQLFERTMELMLLPFTTLGASASIAGPAPAAEAAPALPVASPAQTAPAEDVEGSAPALFDTPKGPADDLLLIKGVGPKLKQLLNSLGVWHFHQIVSWTPAEVAWVNAKIDFKGRIQREGWQAQAAQLLKQAKAA